MVFYDLVVKDSQGKEVSLSVFRGKVLLIFNSATRCFFTKQYHQLEELYQKYHEQGLEILDFPCNQFAHQSPEDEEGIARFCQLHFHTSFPLFRKVAVNGKEASALFVYLKQQKHGLLGNDIKWNFTKFLIDREGNVVERYAPNASLTKIEEKIKELL